ncbi:MAG: hypothetical protein LBT10_00210, partial [Methanobrevibacter sp.]|nr:hypothetical protein [Methanobrevibacter sp.]
MVFFMNYRIVIACFLICLMVCGNSSIIYAVDKIPSGNDLKVKFNEFESDYSSAIDLFNNKYLYVDPSKSDGFKDFINGSIVYSNLKDAVANSSPGDTIYLKEGNYTGDENTGINIPHNLNIIGLSPIPDKINETNGCLADTTNDTGIIINAEGKNNFFNIPNSCSVELGNLTLINAYSSDDNGGAINNNGKLLIN